VLLGNKHALALAISIAAFPSAACFQASPLLSRSDGIVLDRKISTIAFAKKKKGGKGGGYGGGRQQPQEKKSVKDARFDAATRQFMFTLTKLSKVLPDKSKKILDNINLSFYPGAKIGIVGLNGSGKSTLLKIMAGVETEYEGLARPLPGASIGYLPQEPVLEHETVQECIDEAVKSSQLVLDEYNDVSMKLADPELSEEEMTKTMEKMEQLTDTIEAGNMWELERVVSRAMDSLRVPAGDSKTDVLSGGEKRRVALCRLLLQNHDMLLLDEPTNHLDAESIAWLEQFLDDFKGTVVCITHDRYFLNNVAKWILELDRGAGIPHEGNYSDFLEAKQIRLNEEKKTQTSKSKAISNELEWIRSNPKAKGNNPRPDLRITTNSFSLQHPKKSKTTVKSTYLLVHVLVTSSSMSPTSTNPSEKRCSSTT